MKPGFLILTASVLLSGCSSITTHTKPYLGTPHYAATDPARVEILPSEPKRPKDRLGELMLDVGGNPSREILEKKLRKAAAKLGADAAFIVSDQTRVFPVVYVDWWGPSFSQSTRRGIIAVVVKYKP